MSNYYDEWHLIFSDSPDMCVKFGTEIKPVINTEFDYNNALNKPSINGVVLVGNKTNEEIDIRSIPNTEIENILK